MHNLKEQYMDNGYQYPVYEYYPAKKSILVSDELQTSILVLTFAGMAWLCFNLDKTKEVTKFKAPQTIDEGKQALGTENEKALKLYYIDKIINRIKKGEEAKKEHDVLKKELFDRFLISKDDYDKIVNCKTEAECEQIKKEI